MKIPDVKSLDGIQKVVNAINLIFFIAVFIGLYMIVLHFVHNILLRILGFLAVYFVDSMLTYCVLKPLSDRAAAEVRRRKH